MGYYARIATATSMGHHEHIATAISMGYDDHITHYHQHQHGL
jgi:hypothetical protein